MRIEASGAMAVRALSFATIGEPPLWRRGSLVHDSWSQSYLSQSRLFSRGSEDDGCLGEVLGMFSGLSNELSL